MPNSLGLGGMSQETRWPSPGEGPGAVVVRESRREVAPTASLADLLGELEQLARADVNQVDDGQVRTEITRIAAALTNAESAAYLERDAVGAWQPTCQVGGQGSDTNDLGEQVHWRSHRERAVRDGVARLWMFDQVSRRTAISAPVARGERSDCVSVTLRLGAEAPSSFVVALQLVATAGTRIWQSRERQRLVVETQAAAAMVELQQRVAACEDADAACRTVAELVQSVVGCDAVLLLGPQAAKTAWQVRGDAPTLPQNRSPELQTFAALASSALAGASQHWWSSDEGNASLFAQVAGYWHASAMLLLRISGDWRTRSDRGGRLERSNGHDEPHRDPNGESSGSSAPHVGAEPAWGALVLFGNPDTLRAASVQPFLRVVAEFVGTSLQRAELGVGNGATKRWLPRWGATWTIVAVGLLLLALAVVPIPRRVIGVATCEPAERRFVVAPHTGLLAESYFRPGDHVVAEQLLARLDDRELQLELSALMADLEIAAKKRDAAFAAHEVAEQQLAELELRRLERRRELLETRRAQLEVRSPITGVVLSGQREAVRNQPLRAGQTLYEIAPGHSLRVEAAIDEADWRYLAVGSEVSVRWEGLAEQEVAGVIERIRPRTEIHDRENVVVVEVRLVTAAPHLAPGMRGVARLTGDPEPLLQTWTTKLRYRWWP